MRASGALRAVVLVLLVGLAFVALAAHLVKRFFAREGRPGPNEDAGHRLVLLPAIWFCLMPPACIAYRWRQLVACDLLGSVASNGGELVAAIRRYEQDHHLAPLVLDDLVPDYLDELPPAGFPSVGEWHYWPHTPRLPGDWELSVEIGGVTPFDYDAIYYAPSVAYLDQMDSVERRVGDWYYCVVCK